MTIPRTIATLTLVVASLTGVHAASFVVSPGQSIQQAINAASAGDNITVQTGNYNENLTINKGLDIRGAGGAVLVTGTLAITSVTTPVYIADISFGKSGASGMTVTGSSNVRMDRAKLVGGGGLTANNSTLYFYKGQFDQNVAFTGGTWTLQRSTVQGTLSSSSSTAKFIASTINNTFTHNQGELTIFQSTLAHEDHRITLTAAQNAWIAYNYIHRDIWLGGGNVQFIGNRMGDVGDANWGHLVYVHAGCNAVVRNNIIANNWNGPNPAWYGIYVESNAGAVKILNNTIYNIFDALYVHPSHVGAEIRGNIHWADIGGRGNPRNGFVVSSSTIVDCNNTVLPITTGVRSSNISNNPQFGSTFFSSTSNLSFALGDSSPSRNTGPSDAVYNDIDGSRSDQGAYGGHSYDPEGRTTLKPVVLSGDVSPLYVKRGGAVTVRARAAVAAAP